MAHQVLELQESSKWNVTQRIKVALGVPVQVHADVVHGEPQRSGPTSGSTVMW